MARHRLFNKGFHTKDVSIFWACTVGPKLMFVRGLVKFVPAFARLFCQTCLGPARICFANINFRPSNVISGHYVKHTIDQGNFGNLD